jgi:hypothetical protein
MNKLNKTDKALDRIKTFAHNASDAVYGVSQQTLQTDRWPLAALSDQRGLP